MHEDSHLGGDEISRSGAFSWSGRGFFLAGETSGANGIRKPPCIYDCEAVSVRPKDPRNEYAGWGTRALSEPIRAARSGADGTPPRRSGGRALAARLRGGGGRGCARLPRRQNHSGKPGATRGALVAAPAGPNPPCSPGRGDRGDDLAANGAGGGLARPDPPSPRPPHSLGDGLVSGGGGGARRGEKRLAPAPDHGGTDAPGLRDLRPRGGPRPRNGAADRSLAPPVRDRAPLATGTDPLDSADRNEVGGERGIRLALFRKSGSGARLADLAGGASPPRGTRTSGRSRVPRRRRGAGCCHGGGGADGLAAVSLARLCAGGGPGPLTPARGCARGDAASGDGRLPLAEQTGPRGAGGAAGPLGREQGRRGRGLAAATWPFRGFAG